MYCLCGGFQTQPICTFIALLISASIFNHNATILLQLKSFRTATISFAVSTNFREVSILKREIMNNESKYKYFLRFSARETPELYLITREHTHERCDLGRFKFLHWWSRAYYVSRKFYTRTCFLFFPLRHVGKQKCNDLGKHKLYLAKILKKMGTILFGGYFHN